MRLSRCCPARIDLRTLAGFPQTSQSYSTIFVPVLSTMPSHPLAGYGRRVPLRIVVVNLTRKTRYRSHIPRSKPAAAPQGLSSSLLNAWPFSYPPRLMPRPLSQLRRFFMEKSHGLAGSRRALGDELAAR